MIKEECRISTFKEQKEKTSLAIGFFDGLHLGHQILLNEILKDQDTIPCILTFQPTFKSNLRNENEELILTQEEKDCLLEKKGIKKEFILPFDEETRNTGVEDFLGFLLKFNAKEIVVGKDFSFGKKALGKAIDLLSLEEKGIKVILKDLLKEKETKISSTLIRSLLKNSKVEEANTYLGYPFFLKGKVIHGLQNGRKISFPTANMDYPKEKVKLKKGVYKTSTLIGGRIYPSMTNIGKHPTVEALDHNIVETHVIGFDNDLYDKDIQVNFLSYLREERKYNSLDELKKQLIIDCKKCL